MSKFRIEVILRVTSEDDEEIVNESHVGAAYGDTHEELTTATGALLVDLARVWPEATEEERRRLRAQDPAGS